MGRFRRLLPAVRRRRALTRDGRPAWVFQFTWASAPGPADTPADGPVEGTVVPPHEGATEPVGGPPVTLLPPTSEPPPHAAPESASARAETLWTANTTATTPAPAAAGPSTAGPTAVGTTAAGPTAGPSTASPTAAPYAAATTTAGPSAPTPTAKPYAAAPAVEPAGAAPAMEPTGSAPAGEPAGAAPAMEPAGGGEEPAAITVPTPSPGDVDVLGTIELVHVRGADVGGFAVQINRFEVDLRATVQIGAVLGRPSAQAALLRLAVDPGDPDPRRELIRELTAGPVWGTGAARHVELSTIRLTGSAGTGGRLYLLRGRDAHPAPTAYLVAPDEELGDLLGHSPELASAVIELMDDPDDPGRVERLGKELDDRYVTATLRAHALLRPGPGHGVVLTVESADDGLDGGWTVERYHQHELNGGGREQPGPALQMLRPAADPG